MIVIGLAAFVLSLAAFVAPALAGDGHGSQPAPGPPQPPSDAQAPAPAAPPGPGAAEAGRQSCECESFDVWIRDGGRHEQTQGGKRIHLFIARAYLTCSAGDSAEDCRATFRIGRPSFGRIVDENDEVIEEVECQGLCEQTIVVERRFWVVTIGPPPFTIRFTVEKSSCGNAAAATETWVIPYDGGGWPERPRPAEPPPADPPAEDCECDSFKVVPRLQNVHSLTIRNGIRRHANYVDVVATLRCRPGLDPSGCKASYTVEAPRSVQLLQPNGPAANGTTVTCSARCGRQVQRRTGLKVIWTGGAGTLRLKLRKSACGADGPATITVTLKYGKGGWLTGMTVDEVSDS
jgi:hypothetical protein